MLMVKNGNVKGQLMTNKLGSSNPNRIKKYKVKKTKDNNVAPVNDTVQSVKIIVRSLAVIAFFIYLSYLIYSDLSVYFSTKL